MVAKGEGEDHPLSSAAELSHNAAPSISRGRKKRVGSGGASSKKSSSGHSSSPAYVANNNNNTTN